MPRSAWMFALATILGWCVAYAVVPQMMQNGLDLVALVVLAFQLPIPLFWLFVHPFKGFWIHRPRQAYYIVGPAVWGGMTAALVVFRDWLLADRLPHGEVFWLVGAALLLLDTWLLFRVEQDLGWRILVGLPELLPGQHGGRLAQEGIYARMRHPRYLGMMLAYFAAASLARAPRLFGLAVAGCLLAVAISELEERELLERLGEEYAHYRQRVPRFIPRWPGKA